MDQLSRSTDLERRFGHSGRPEVCSTERGGMSAYCAPSRNKRGFSRRAGLRVIDRARGRGLALSVYRCPHCGRWHLTSRGREPS